MRTLLVCALLVVGCDDDQKADMAAPDLSVPPDLSASADLSVPDLASPDLASAADLAVIVDATPPADLVPPQDMTPEVDATPPGDMTPPVIHNVLYLSANAGLGNLGVAGADNACNQARPPGLATAKAMIVDGVTRRACTSANCTTGGASEHIDWVFAPMTSYYLADGTTFVGATNAAGLLVGPLQTPVAANGAFWTGLSNDWTGSNNCVGWTSVGSVGSVGRASVTDIPTFISQTTTSTCGIAALYLCVGQ
jgi:hypothetical protein